ncbi:hypothetical protein C8Q78DRAFT_499992 [Trametes maxima]|nr:hypothetical protein C8Q78DRAFT_499992 [Trametes maxima]
MISMTTSKSKKAKAHEPSSAAPPRPSNKFFLYRQEKRLEIKAMYPHITEGEVSKQVSAMWAAEPPEVKEEYTRRAQVAKVEHAATYPDYKYTPRLNKERKDAEKARDAQVRVAAKMERARERREARKRARAEKASSRAGPSRLSESASPIPSDASGLLPFFPNLFGMLAGGVLGSSMMSPAYGARVSGQVDPAFMPAFQPSGPSEFSGVPYMFPHVSDMNPADPFPATIDPALLRLENMSLGQGPRDQEPIPPVTHLQTGPLPSFGFGWVPAEASNIPPQWL